MKQALQALLTAALLIAVCRPAAAQTIQFTKTPGGYEAGSVTLPRPFGGALSAHPTNPNRVFVAVGGYGAMDLARVDISTGDSAIIATGFGALGGIAAISDEKIVLIDNIGSTPGDLNDTFLLATDLNTDGDFLDANEVRELIDPILADSFFGFTGAQTRLIPSSEPAGIPAGSILTQTADGAGISELLIIENPLSTPVFRPAGAAFFSGFDYNGGVDFDSQGRIWMGTLTGSFAGQVWALVNTNGDEDIDAGESNLVVDGEGGMADLVVDAENDVFFAGSNAMFQSAVRTFRTPDDALNTTATPHDFAVTDAGFLSGILINSKERPFDHGSGPDAAVMLIGGWISDFSAPGSNLLTLKPALPTSTTNWQAYR